MLRAEHEEEVMIGADYATQAEMDRCESHMPGIFTMRLFRVAAIDAKLDARQHRALFKSVARCAPFRSKIAAFRISAARAATGGRRRAVPAQTGKPPQKSLEIIQPGNMKRAGNKSLRRSVSVIAAVSL